MITIKSLIWDKWNRDHITKHNVTPEEIEDVCHGRHEVIQSYRKRLQLIGTTKAGKTICIVLSPEDRNLKPYPPGTYYVITTFEKEEV